MPATGANDVRKSPTQKTRTVRLTLAQWNLVLCIFSDAARADLAKGYTATALQTRALQDVIRDQVQGAIDAAFCKEYPEEEAIRLTEDEQNLAMEHADKIRRRGVQV